MASSVVNEYDVVVLGDHPCTYVAAALLRLGGVQRIGHLTIPTDRSADRAVLVNPRLFSLDKRLGPVRERVAMTPVDGVRFLSDDPTVAGEHVASAPIAYVARLADLAKAMRDLAADAGVVLGQPQSLAVAQTEPGGAELVVDGRCVRAKALVVGGHLSERCRRRLGIPLSWAGDIQRRLYFTELPAGRANGAVITPMSLDLEGSLRWAWLLSTPDARHLVVEQSGNHREPKGALQHWANVLTAHKQLEPTKIDPAAIEWVDAPIAGALAQDGVADRTVLIGPAGGFYSACGEDIYPNVWSAIHAVKVLRAALDASPFQDALDAYRSCWRTELGFYLQGLQQNLRLLLPMVYKNPAMTARLAEAILVGKNVIH